MYFITGFTKYEIDERTGAPDIGSDRTFGYFFTRQDAIDAVKNNACDIFEYLYTYMVIERITEGLYNLATDRIFFKWNNKERKFEEIEPIKDNWGNFAIG